MVPRQGGLSMKERPFPWPREAEQGDAGQEPERDELRPKNGRFLTGRGTSRLNNGLEDEGELVDEALPSASFRAGHGAQLGKGWS